MISKGDDKNIVQKTELPQNVKAPVSKGDRVGYIIFSKGKEILGKYPVTAAEDVREISLGEIFSLVLRAFSE